MMYRYVARDPLGNLLHGSLDVESLDMANQMLDRDGLQVVKLVKESAGLDILAPRVRKSDIVNLTTQLSIMTDTGITLAAALEGVLEQEENPTMKRILNNLRADVEAGEDFSVALAKHPKYFDDTYVALVRASEETGSLPDMLRQIAQDMQKEIESRARVRSALAYPTIMLFVAIAVTIFLLTFVMPKFAPIFSKKGVKLPTATIVMMQLSETLINHWYAWTAAVVVLVAAILIGRRTLAGRRLIDYGKINAPILGTMFRKLIISRCLRTFGAMIGSGVMVLDALQRTSEVAGNYYYEQEWLKVVDEVTNGSRICESLQGSALFPRTLVQMIGSGEEAGKLDVVLKKVSTHYEREVETSLKTVTSLLEPIMIIAMGGVVGGIGMSLLLPIFKLSRAM